MTFIALLTKELRLRMRRERTIWLMIIYVLLLGLTGWLIVNNLNNNASTDIGIAGRLLYAQLSLLQLFLVIFITPAFTATTINGEKRRQTFDLLLCSQISGFSIAAGKLVAGLTNTLLLIAASIPLFSLLLFFGGVEPARLLIVLLIYIVTALQVGTLGLFCSILFRHPAVSIAITYILTLFWLTMPYLILIFWNLSTRQFPSSQQIDFLFLWSPLTPLFSPNPVLSGSFTSLSSILRIAPWITYTLVSLLVTGILFSLCAQYARPHFLGHWHIGRKKEVTTAIN
jgi:ABC-type transport system involved in multi-copper enzyme maturation permease subunit